MSDSGNLRKAAKILLILFSGLFLTGCYSLKTIPVNSALSFPQKRSILVIHTDDNFWAIDDFAITGNDGRVYNISSERCSWVDRCAKGDLHTACRTQRASPSDNSVCVAECANRGAKGTVVIAQGNR